MQALLPGKALGYYQIYFYKGLVMAGGWFCTPKDGILYLDENKTKIDMWPNVLEYEKTYPSTFQRCGKVH